MNEEQKNPEILPSETLSNEEKNKIALEEMERMRVRNQLNPPPRKSVAVSIILTILFGPLGMFYSTVQGGIIMVIVSAVLASLTLGLSLIITWPIGIIWGAMAVEDCNKGIYK